MIERVLLVRRGGKVFPKWIHTGLKWIYFKESFAFNAKDRFLQRRPTTTWQQTQPFQSQPRVNSTRDNSISIAQLEIKFSQSQCLLHLTWVGATNATSSTKLSQPKKSTSMIAWPPPPSQLKAKTQASSFLDPFTSLRKMARRRFPPPPLLSHLQALLEPLIILDWKSSPSFPSFLLRFVLRFGREHFLTPDTSRSNRLSLWKRMGNTMTILEVARSFMRHIFRPWSRNTLNGSLHFWELEASSSLNDLVLVRALDCERLLYVYFLVG